MNIKKYAFYFFNHKKGHITNENTFMMCPFWVRRVHSQPFEEFIICRERGMDCSFRSVEDARPHGMWINRGQKSK